jgi:competence protein ComEC
MHSFVSKAADEQDLFALHSQIVDALLMTISAAAAAPAQRSAQGAAQPSSSSVLAYSARALHVHMRGVLKGSAREGAPPAEPPAAWLAHPCAPVRRSLATALGAPALQADLLIAPHHGSRTSSTPAFLQAVAPRWAIFQVGYRNRFGHPAPVVLKRYRDQGIGVLRTDRDGAISIQLRAGAEPRIALARREPARYWRMGVPEAAEPEAEPASEPERP